MRHAPTPLAARLGFAAGVLGVAALVWATGCSGTPAAPAPPAAAPGGFCEALADLGGPQGDEAGYYREVATLGGLAPTRELADALDTIGRNVEASGGDETDIDGLWANPDFARSVSAVAEFWVAECVDATDPPDTAGQ
jgi:hypothetical protein